MRALYRALGPRMAGTLPEVRRLFGDDLRRRLAEPFRLDAMVAALPGSAYAAATM